MYVCVIDTHNLEKLRPYCVLSEWSECECVCVVDTCLLEKLTPGLCPRVCVCVR